MQNKKQTVVQSGVKFTYANAANKTLSPQTMKAMSKQILQDVDTYCQTAYDDGHRKHLGASLIGEECSRKLWYSFRWVKKEKFLGRVLRLFNRGHREEERFVEWLRGIGFEVREVDTELDADGNEKQIRIGGVSGHFGGSLDGETLPPYIDLPMLLEFKTSGTGRGFTELTTKGVKIAKPMHYAQMSTYGRKRNLKYALYMCINKNDDDLHVEIVELDWSLAERLEEKAGQIITAKEPPLRIAATPAYEACKYCVFSDICHGEAVAEKNCRSCQHSEPIDNGKWFCHVYKGEIPNEFIPQGCDQHLGVK